jgi:hypothetical protein
MNATLTIDGKDVCTMEDLGDGSQPKFTAINKPLFELWEIVVKDLPVMFVDAYQCDMKIDNAMFIDILHYSLVNKTEFNLLKSAQQI